DPDPELLASLQHFYHSYFPFPSPAELPDDRQNSFGRLEDRGRPLEAVLRREQREEAELRRIQGMSREQQLRYFGLASLDDRQAAPVQAEARLLQRENAAAAPRTPRRSLAFPVIVLVLICGMFFLHLLSRQVS